MCFLTPLSWKVMVEPMVVVVLFYFEVLEVAVPSVVGVGDGDAYGFDGPGDVFDGGLVVVEVVSFDVFLAVM